MKQVRRLALMVCGFVNRWFIIPVASWASRGMFGDAGVQGIPEYIEPSPKLNSLVLARVFNDLEEGWAKSPEVLQGELNGCMSLMRSEVSIRFMKMSAGLIQNYPPDEVFVRMMANALQLGMYLERRLKDS